MECLVENKKIRLNPYHMKYSKEISKVKGTTADVYLIKDKAYKLYRLPYSKEPITKEIIDAMKKIETTRIVLPEAAIENKRHLIVGTVSSYIEDLGLDNLLAFSKEEFIYNVKALYDDSILLGEKGIKVADLFLRNFVFHNGMYFIDCGKFYFLDMDANVIISKNIEEMNLFFIHSFLIPLMAKYATNKAKSSSRLKEDFYDRLRNSISMTEIFEEDFKESTLEKYLIKRAKMK